MKVADFEHPKEVDLPAMTAIFNDSTAELPSQRTLQPDEMRAFTFSDRDFDPAGAWLARIDGEAVAYAYGFVDSERRSYTKADSYLEVEVVRNQRGRGIEEDLVSRVTGYLMGRGIIGINASFHETDSWREKLLHDFGFGEIRRYYEMTRRPGQTPEPPGFPDNLQVRHMLISESSDDDLSRLAAVRNESFVDHFNYSPIPDDRMKNYLRCGDTVFSAALVEDRGCTVGFVLSEDIPTNAGEDKSHEGWVAMLGVVGSHRKRGLGRALLSESVRWLSGQGVGTVRLLVDAENDKALGMYRSAGFSVDSVEILTSRSLAYPEDRVS